MNSPRVACRGQQHRVSRLPWLSFCGLPGWCLGWDTLASFLGGGGTHESRCCGTRWGVSVEEFRSPGVGSVGLWRGSSEVAGAAGELTGHAMCSASGNHLTSMERKLKTSASPINLISEEAVRLWAISTIDRNRIFSVLFYFNIMNPSLPCWTTLRNTAKDTPSQWWGMHRTNRSNLGPPS